MRAPTVLAQKSLQAEAAERPRGYVDMICDLSVDDVYHWKLIFLMMLPDFMMEM